MRSPSTIFGMILILISCSGNEHVFRAPETYEPTQIAESIAVEYCAAFRRCRNDVRAEHVLHLDVCVDQLGRLLHQRLSPLTDSVDAAKVAYDPAGLRRCLKAIHDGTCRDIDLETFEADCAGVVRGTQPAGEPCLYDAECEGGFCPGDDGCSSLCERLSADGGSCAIDGDLQCQAGLDCDDDDVCHLKGQAQYLAGLGELCHVHRCRAGLRCVRTPEPVCLPFGLIYGRQAGQLCRAARDTEPEMGCGLGLVCSFDMAPMVDGDGICRRLPKAGERCHLTIGGSNAWCEPGHYCQGLDPIGGILEGRCVPFPERDGECGEFFGRLRTCGPDERCVDERCVARAQAGEVCSTHRDCVHGRCWDGVCEISCHDSED